MGWQSTSIAKPLIELSDAPLTNEDARHAVLKSIRMMYQDVHAHSLKSYIRRHIKEPSSQTEFSTHLMESVECWRLKVWLYWCATHRLTNDQCIQVAPEFQIPDHDLGLYRAIPLLDDMFAKFASKGYLARPLKDIDREIESTVVNYKPFCYSEIGKRISFIVKNSATGITKDSAYVQGSLSAIQAVRRRYPAIEMVAHTVRIYKKSFTYALRNIIERNTSDKNAALQVDGDGFVSTSVVIDDKLHTDSMVMHEDHDDAHTIDQLINHFDGVDRVIASVMLGKFNDEFSQFLGKPNDDYYNRKSIGVYKRRFVKFLNQKYKLKSWNRFHGEAWVDSIIDRMRDLV